MFLSLDAIADVTSRIASSAAAAADAGIRIAAGSAQGIRVGVSARPGLIVDIGAEVIFHFLNAPFILRDQKRYGDDYRNIISRCQEKRANHVYLARTSQGSG
jgi:hypothetical protein